MTPEKKPEIIELDRYRKAAEARAAKQAKVKVSPPSERLLGPRKHAGWLLVLVILATVAMIVLPRFIKF